MEYIKITYNNIYNSNYIIYNTIKEVNEEDADNFWTKFEEDECRKHGLDIKINVIRSEFRKPFTPFN
jgi:hypothetical protein